MTGSVVSHYRVLDRLGAGGMGIVYRAEDLRLGRHVAIKVLPEAAVSDPLAVERFQREARTASALNHPNICTLHDVGEFDSRRFIVMELIDGATLDRVLAAGALPVDRVVEIGAQVADALDAAHSEGILHRDIKPGNIFVTRRGQVKVVDFGLAKMMPQRVGAFAPVAVTLAESHFSTSAGTAVGTVAYMSPEHARGESVDPRSDLFSLGVVLYEMSTGVQTFKGQTTAVIFDQILNRIPLPPSQVNPDVVPALEQIIGRLLEKDRALRFQTARDLHAELLRLKRDLESRRVLTSASAMASPPSVSSTWAAQSLPASSETMAVNVPIYGVDAPPTPVPAAWAQDWMPSERPSAPATPPAATPPPMAPAISSPSSAAPPVPAPAVPAPGSTAGVPAAPVSTPSHVPAAEPTPPPAPPAAVSHAVVAQPVVPPASTTVARPSPSPASARPAPRPKAVPLTAAAALVGLIAAGAWWFTSGPDVPADASTSTPPPVVIPASTAPPSAPETSAPEMPPPIPVAVDTKTTPPTVATAGVRRPTATPPKPAPPAAAPVSVPAVEAASMLSRAKSSLAAGHDAEAIATLTTLAASFGSTPAGRDGLLLLAQTHHKAGNLREAIEAWSTASRAGFADDQAAEGLIRAADAAARQRATESDTLARRALGELLDRHPSSVRALRALHMKMALEDRLKLKDADEEFKGQTPTSLLTLRQTARQAGTTAVAEFALWRLAQEYRDRRLHEQAAATFAELATRFPATKYDAWFAAAEVYEKQLRDAERARSAYANVPATSPKYEQAQKKLK